MYSPFGMNSARHGFGQQGSNQPYDFKGLESRLGKIETGIAGLPEQFGNFQMPGQETVDPAYTGNATRPFDNCGTYWWNSIFAGIASFWTGTNKNKRTSFSYGETQK